MAIKTRSGAALESWRRGGIKGTPEYYLRKADQHWDMAGLARQDGDMAGATRHTEEARRLMQMAREARQ